MEVINNGYMDDTNDDDEEVVYGAERTMEVDYYGYILVNGERDMAWREPESLSMQHDDPISMYPSVRGGGGGG